MKLNEPIQLEHVKHNRKRFVTLFSLQFLPIVFDAKYFLRVI